MTRKPQPTCPDCEVPMESGRMMIPYASQLVHWITGDQKPHWLLGLKAAQKTVIEAFRCPHCGLVRNYA